MAEVAVIKASARAGIGKGAARQTRREGRVPAVIYGDKKPPDSIALDYNDLWKLIQKGRFTATLFEIDVDGRRQRVLAREVQFDPVKDFPIHVDFNRIGADGRVRVSVPMKFINDALSPGLKRGGVLNVVRYQIEVTCPADRIPSHFEANLEGLEIGRSIHISAVQLPPDVRPTIINRDFTIATIAGAVKEVEPTPGVAAEGAEPTAGAPTTATAAAAPAAGDAKAPAAAAAAPAKGGAAPAKGGDKKK
jgi:large subunit ribosomal protein L25